VHDDDAPMNRARRSVRAVLTALLLCASPAAAQVTITEERPTTGSVASQFRSPEDGWLDVSGFLDEEYGFLPVTIPITEPAVGYGAAVGLMFLTYDSRDNMFTPSRGTYVETVVGVFDKALGGDDQFERLQLTAMHFRPLARTLYLGLRLDGAATFGDVPFYLRPFISLRGAPIMRYQGDETAQVEAELRWQFWKRFSVVAFAGAGAAWNDFARLDDVQKIATGGFGFRYELARTYGIHAGLDLAFSPGNQAVYVQVGSAWARP
jgi:hypothetical protein